jgi:hypothetical protein
LILDQVRSFAKAEARHATGRDPEATTGLPSAQSGRASGCQVGSASV